MHRLLIDVRLLSRGTLSGIEEYTTQLVSHLLTADRTNEYLLFANSLRSPHLPTSWLTSGNARLINWRLPNKLLDPLTRFTRRPKIDRATGADLVLSPHFNNLEVATAPRVVTFHDLSFIHHPYFFTARQRLWHWLQHYERQAQTARAIIAVSEFTKADLISSLGVPPERIHVIYPGLNPLFKKLPDGKALATYRKRRDIELPYLLYLGTIEPRKNVAAAVRAFNLLKTKPAFKDLRLVLAGKPGWRFKDVLREIASSTFRDHIIQLGAVDNEERVLLYTGARAFVYPSFFEGFGFPPLEAQACGCPTVAADRTSLPESLGTSSLLVDPWRIGELADALETAITENSTRERIITAGLQNARRFDWTITASRTIALLDAIS